MLRAETDRARGARLGPAGRRDRSGICINGPRDDSSGDQRADRHSGRGSARVAVRRGSNLASAEARTTAGGGQLTENTIVGVPDGSFNLPSFNFYGKPFFERQGLRFRVGPVHLRMSLFLGEEYNTNILGSHTDPLADYITHIAPQFQIGMGDFRAQAEDYLLFEYRPSFDYYLEHNDRNRVNETLDLSARAPFRVTRRRWSSAT